MLSHKNRAKFGFPFLTLLVVFCFLASESASAQGLKLPTTWDYVRGFTEGGMDAWNAVQTVRGSREGRGRVSRIRPRSERRSQGGDVYDPVELHHHQHYDPHYVPNEQNYDPLPKNVSPSPHHYLKRNKLPESVRIPGKIRPIEDSLATLSGGAVVNLEEYHSVLRYRLNDRDYELPPGYYQDLGPKDTWVIEFDRGADFGHARYTVSGHKYAFTPTENGWDLFEQ